MVANSGMVDGFVNRYPCCEAGEVNIFIVYLSVLRPYLFLGSVFWFEGKRVPIPDDIFCSNSVGGLYIGICLLGYVFMKGWYWNTGCGGRDLSYDVTICTCGLGGNMLIFWFCIGM